nr:MAG TPA: hypothetical protein [Caudoviricetes sp.]
MEPIVNPWLIYLVSIVEHLRNFFNAITFVVCALDILIVMGTFIESDDAIAVFYNREEKKIKPFIKLLIALTIICPLLVIFIPSKETIIAMYIANMITPDNLNFANEVFKSNLKDYMDIISGALNK